MNIQNVDKENLFWLIAVHVTFVVSGLLLAAMDYIVSRTKPAKTDG
jgi:uncharacterized membrane protein YqhA